MGIFDKFFKKEKVSFKELEAWLRKRESDSQALQVQEFLRLYKEIASNKKEIRERLSELQSAELHNKNIPEKEKHIMSGNREAYIQKVKSFIDRLDIPESGSIEQALVFISTYKKDLETLTKGSQKSYFVVMEFFGNEVKSVAAGLRGLDNLVKSLKDKMESAKPGAESFSNTRNLFAMMRSSGARLRELSAEHKRLMSEKSIAAIELAEVKKDLEKNRRSIGYKGYLEQIKALEAKDREIKDLKDSFGEDFSVLDRALRKFAKVSTEEVFITSYLENPINALTNDSELKIVAVLERVRAEVVKGTLELKDRKQEKTIHTIGKLSREYLISLRDRFAMLKRERSELDDSVRSNLSGVKQSEIESRLGELESRLGLLEKSIEDVLREKDKLNPEKIREEIRNSAEKTYGIEII